MFRFTIRDVLWLTVVAAVLTTWSIDRVRLQRTIKSLEFKSNWVPLVSPFSRVGSSSEAFAAENSSN